MIKETFRSLTGEPISTYEHGDKFRQKARWKEVTYRDYIMFTMDEWVHIKDKTINIITSLDPTKEYKVYFISSSFPSLLLNRIKSNNPNLNIKRTKSVENADLVVTDFAYDNKYDFAKEFGRNFFVKGHSNIDNNISLWYGYNYIDDYTSNIDLLLQDLKNDSEYCHNISVGVKIDSSANTDTCESLFGINKPVMSTADFSIFVIGYLPTLKQEDKDNILNMIKSSDFESRILGLQVLTYYNLKNEFVLVLEVLQNIYRYGNCTSSILKYLRYLINIPEYFYYTTKLNDLIGICQYAKHSHLGGEEINKDLLERAREQLKEIILRRYKTDLDNLNIKLEFSINDEDGEAVTDPKELGES